MIADRRILNEAKGLLREQTAKRPATGVVLIHAMAVLPDNHPAVQEVARALVEQRRADRRGFRRRLQLFFEQFRGAAVCEHGNGRDCALCREKACW